MALKEDFGGWKKTVEKFAFQNWQFVPYFFCRYDFENQKDYLGYDLASQVQAGTLNSN